MFVLADIPHIWPLNALLLRPSSEWWKPQYWIISLITLIVPKSLKMGGPTHQSLIVPLVVDIGIYLVPPPKDWPWGTYGLDTKRLCWLQKTSLKQGGSTRLAYARCNEKWMWDRWVAELEFYCWPYCKSSDWVRIRCVLPFRLAHYRRCRDEALESCPASFASVELRV